MSTGLNGDQAIGMSVDLKAIGSLGMATDCGDWICSQNRSSLEQPSRVEDGPPVQGTVVSYALAPVIRAIIRGYRT
jgi:hypothetical protein